MSFVEKICRMVKKNNSLLCVGLDIDIEKIPPHLDKNKDLFYFNKEIIDATLDYICCYKINTAFYEVLGVDGIELLKKTIEYIPKDIPIILDGKRNDIGNTARMYAREMFEFYDADATTVNPYLGWDGIEPFLRYVNKYVFVLCRTSNPSAKDFQDLIIEDQNIPLYQTVAHKIKEWNKNHNCGAVVGATYPEEIKLVRDIIEDEPFILIPGVGKQGGDLEKAVRYGTNSEGERAIINVSRSIIYAGRGKDFASTSGKEAKRIQEEINSYRP